MKVLTNMIAEITWTSRNREAGQEVIVTAVSDYQRLNYVVALNFKLWEEKGTKNVFRNKRQELL